MRIMISTDVQYLQNDVIDVAIATLKDLLKMAELKESLNKTDMEKVG